MNDDSYETSAEFFSVFFILDVHIHMLYLSFEDKIICYYMANFSN